LQDDAITLAGQAHPITGVQPERRTDVRRDDDPPLLAQHHCGIHASRMPQQVPLWHTRCIGARWSGQAAEQQRLGEADTLELGQVQSLVGTARTGVGILDAGTRIAASG